ncbi:MAG: hypothetical protein RR424_04595 [Oscillospiraceae bacterium]
MPMESAGAPISATFEYNALFDEYGGMIAPCVQLLLGGMELRAEGTPLIVDNLIIELTAGYEASVASFRIYNVYDHKKGTFRYEDIKNQLYLGAVVKLDIGYLTYAETVFVGFVAGISFGYDPGDLPYIEVSCMDIKGLMMANSYAAQLKAKSYGEAVREIFTRPGSSYEKFKLKEGYIDLEVSDTPDKQEGGGGDSTASAETIEMVTESDYEFIVRAAKRFNFEFFVDRGIIYFRKAKSDKIPLMQLSVGEGLISFRIEYSITGIVGSIEARAINSADGKLVTYKKKMDNEISTASAARDMVSEGSKVFVDPSIITDIDAEARVDSLMEKMSYRLGNLEAECFGIPELCPGRFITIHNMETPGDNDFYIMRVTHTFSSDRGYRTSIVGCADKVQNTEVGMP